MEEEFTKPESVAYILMNARQYGLDADYVPQLQNTIATQNRKTVNNIIRESLPVFDSLLRIVVSPDSDAIADACVIETIDDWQTCN